MKRLDKLNTDEKYYVKKLKTKNWKIKKYVKKNM